jgi:hypothetical protein
MVHVALPQRRQALDRLQRELAVGSRHRQQLGPAGEEFRSVCLVDGDMRGIMADEPQGGVSDASDSALAAVPVATGRIATSCSNNCAIRASSLSVISSAP